MLRDCKGKVRLKELLGTGINNRLSTKVKTHSNVAKHSFLVLHIVSCDVAITLNNFEFKLLPFLFKDLLGLCGHKSSRDLICIMLL